MKARIINNSDWGGNHSEVWLSNNANIIFAEQLVSEWYLTNVLPSSELTNPFWNGTEWIEGFTEEELQNYALKCQVENEFRAYEQRRRDGIKAYNQINAEFRVLKLNGVIEQGYYDSISELLEDVIFQITNGQWVSGLQKLELLGSSGIGQTLYDRLHLQISNYITENYQ